MFPLNNLQSLGGKKTIFVPVKFIITYLVVFLDLKVILFIGQRTFKNSYKSPSSETQGQLVGREKFIIGKIQSGESSK